MTTNKMAIFTRGALASVFFLLCLAGASPAINVEITNVNLDTYPGIHVFVRATDDNGFYLEDLGVSNFQLRENGTLVDLGVEAQWGYMAATLVMDQSASMSGFEQDVIDACSYFVNGMDELDKGAIVKFATSSNVAVPMTYDKDALLQAISTYITSGSTDLWDAVYLGIQECLPEPEKKAVVTFTDGNDNQPGVSAAQLPGFAGTDVSIYMIGIGNIDPDSLIWIANQTGGFYLPIADPTQMQEVLEDIRQDIGNLYDVFYYTPDPSLNGSTRALELVCVYQGQSDWDTTSYVAPLYAPPDITLSPTTLALLGVAQNAGITLNISCDVGSPNPITDARIYYKTTGAIYFTQADLINGPGHNYYYNLPGSFVQNPGVQFYLQVTDSEGNTATLPGFNPGALPFHIPVLPNYAPAITYDPPDVWLERRSLPLQVTVTDNTNDVTQVSLYYRIAQAFFYTECPMTYMGNDTYEYTIEGPNVNEHDDLVMFIAAWDDHGVANYWNLSDDPYFLDVVAELAPTLPVVVLESEAPPIIIPATGGSFFYTLNVINPIPDYGECDAWADLVLPDGSIQELGIVEGGIILEGGTSYINAYVQEVPDTALAGDYLFRMHTGDYATLEEYYTDSFPFTKSATMSGAAPFTRGWYWYAAADQPPAMEDPLALFLGDQIQAVQGFPNPFNARTSIEFYLTEASQVTLAIYNVRGQEVARLTDGYSPAGSYKVLWDAEGIPSGMYLCRLTTNRGILTTRLSLVK